MSKPITIVCGACGSTNVRRDAWAEWSDENQEWILGTVFDAGHCEDCEGDSRLEEVPLLPAEPPTSRPDYPGASAHEIAITKGEDHGSVRIMDYGPGVSTRWRVALFMPGVYQELPGDTPKTWPEQDHWTNDWALAVEIYAGYRALALSHHWRIRS